MTDKRLVLMVGLPRSGKTTAARYISTQWQAPIVNPDAIRLALHGQAFYPQAEPMVWAIAKTMVRSLFLAGHDTVIVDACNNTKKRRAEWKSWQEEWELESVTVYETKEALLKRARDNSALIATIERMIEQYEPVEHGECAEDWYIDRKSDEEYQLVRQEGLEPSPN